MSKAMTSIVTPAAESLRLTFPSLVFSGEHLLPRFAELLALPLGHLPLQSLEGSWLLDCEFYRPKLLKWFWLGQTWLWL